MEGMIYSVIDKVFGDYFDRLAEAWNKAMEDSNYQMRHLEREERKKQIDEEDWTDFKKVIDQYMYEDKKEDHTALED